STVADFRYFQPCFTEYSVVHPFTGHQEIEDASRVGKAQAVSSGLRRFSVPWPATCPEHAGQVGSHPAPVSRGPGRMDSMSFSRNWCGIVPYQALTQRASSRLSIRNSFGCGYAALGAMRGNALLSPDPEIRESS